MIALAAHFCYNINGDEIEESLFKSVLADCLEIKRILISSINTAKEEG